MASPTPIIIAIDGPAASGKSTVSKRVARELGCLFVSSGEMYRAFTHWVLEKGVDPNDEEQVTQLLAATLFTCRAEGGIGTIQIDDTPITAEEMSAEAVNGAVSLIAKIPAVRRRLVAEQRGYADFDPGVVMEGRDIGTVVFPDTAFKFYVDASPEVRQARRRAQGIEDSVAERDAIDSSRKDSPLAIAEGALVVDSSHMAVDEVVAEITGQIAKIRAAQSI